MRRRFCFPYLKYDANWSQWEMWFLQVFVTKTSIRLFSSNEHEMNLNRRRRQLQSPVVGVWVFLWRILLEFWFFFAIIMAINLGKLRKILNVFSRSRNKMQENCWGSLKTSKKIQDLRKRSKRVLHQTNTRSF